MSTRGQWTYGGNPAASGRDELRFLIGDTDEKNPVLFDGECDYLLHNAADVPLLAAIAATEQLIIEARAMVDQSVGSVSVSWSQRSTNLVAILAMLRRRLVTSGFAGVYSGGISVSAKDANSTHSDLVPPQLTVRQNHGRNAYAPDNVTTDGSQLTGRFDP